MCNLIPGMLPSFDTSKKQLSLLSLKKHCAIVKLQQLVGRSGTEAISSCDSRNQKRHVTISIPPYSSRTTSLI